MTPSPAASLVDWTLEASVVGSFSRIGYHTRRRLFDWTPLQSLRLDGKVAIVTGGTSGLGRSAAESIAELGGNVCIVGRDPERTERVRSEISVAGRPRGRGRPRRSLVSRRDRGLRRAFRRGSRPPGPPRPERWGANPQIHGHRRGQRADVRDSGPFTVPAHPCAAASARGGGTVARDRGGIGRHVHRAARRRCPRRGAGHVRRDERIRALQASTGRAGRGVDATAARHRHHRQRHASRLGRHPRAPNRAARLHPRRRAAAPDAGGRSRHDRLARGSPGRRGDQRSVLPRPASACEAPPAPYPSSGRGPRGGAAMAALRGAHGPVRGGWGRLGSEPEPKGVVRFRPRRLRSVAAFRRRRSCGAAKACTSRRDRAHRLGRRSPFAE